MNKDRSAELFGGAPDGLKRGIIEIQRIEPAEMLIRVNVRADLRAAQAELAHASLELARGKIGILERNCRQAGEPCRVRADDFCNVVVQPPREIESVARFCPIAEHDRHRGKDLHGDAGLVHFFEATGWFPNVIGNFPKDALADHHSRAAWLVMLQPNESGVAVLRVEVGPLARKNVSVEIDLHKIMVGTSRCGVHGHRSAMSLPRTARPARAGELWRRSFCRCAAHHRSRNRAWPG